MRADILVEHAEEAAILWSRRADALVSPRETLATLEALERRLDAHLAGLAVDTEGEHPCFERGLTGVDAGAAFAAAATLLRIGTLSSRARVLHALPGAHPEAARGIGAAFAYLLAGDAPQFPLNAGPSRRLERHAYPATRDAALWALAGFGAPDALAALRDALEVAPATPARLELLGCLGDAADVPLLARAAREPALAEAAIRALGALGVTEAAEALVQAMREDTLAPAAGEAFARITGIAVVPAPGPAADDDAHFEELRARPDPDAMAALWRERRDAFATGTRWRHGRALDTGAWLADPHAGDLLTRREEITRLRALVPGTHRDLDLDAPAVRQRSSAP